MNAKQYLNQLRTLASVIRARKGQLERLRAEQTFISAVSYDADRVQTSGNTDPMRGVDRLLSLEQEIAQKVEAAERIRSRIIDEIESLQNPLYVTILIKRYVEGLNFEKIADQMRYSYMYVIHLHGEALQDFAQMKGGEKTDEKG